MRKLIILKQNNVILIRKILSYWTTFINGCLCSCQYLSLKDLRLLARSFILVLKLHLVLSCPDIWPFEVFFLKISCVISQRIGCYQRRAELFNYCFSFFVIKIKEEMYTSKATRLLKFWWIPKLTKLNL